MAIDYGSGKGYAGEQPPPGQQQGAPPKPAPWTTPPAGGKLATGTSLYLGAGATPWNEKGKQAFVTQTSPSDGGYSSGASAPATGQQKPKYTKRLDAGGESMEEQLSKYGKGSETHIDDQGHQWTRIIEDGQEKWYRNDQGPRKDAGAGYADEVNRGLPFSGDAISQAKTINMGAFNVPTQPTPYWEKLANAQLDWKTDDAQVNWARQQSNAARFQEQAALQRFLGLADGKDSIVAQQAAEARARGAQGIASQLASAGGGVDPAAMRYAQQAQSGLEQNSAMASAIGQSQERQAALQQYLAGTQQMRGQDMQRMQLESAEAQRQAQEEIARRQLQKGFLEIGLSAVQAAKAAEMELERLKVQAAQGDRQMSLAEGNASFNKGMQVAQGVVGAASTGAGLLGTIAKAAGGGGGGTSDGDIVAATKDWFGG